MSLNLFRHGELPPGAFADDIRSLASITPEVLIALQSWLAKTEHFYDLSYADFKAGHPSIDIEEEQFDLLLDVTYYVLNRVFENELDGPQLEADFLKIGLEANGARRLSDYLVPLKPLGERLLFETQKLFYEQAGSPTLDDANFVCDLRPIFAGPAFEGSPMRPTFNRLLGFVPMVTAEFIVSGSDDVSHRMSFQMNETKLRELTEGLARCLTQFEQCKQTASTFTKLV